MPYCLAMVVGCFTLSVLRARIRLPTTGSGGAKGEPLFSVLLLVDGCD